MCSNLLDSFKEIYGSEYKGIDEEDIIIKFSGRLEAYRQDYPPPKYKVIRKVYDAVITKQGKIKLHGDIIYKSNTNLNPQQYIPVGTIESDGENLIMRFYCSELKLQLEQKQPLDTNFNYSQLSATEPKIAMKRFQRIIVGSVNYNEDILNKFPNLDNKGYGVNYPFFAIIDKDLESNLESKLVRGYV